MWQATQRATLAIHSGSFVNSISLHSICWAAAEPTKDACVVGQGHACPGVNLDKGAYTALSTLDELVGGPVCQATRHNVPCLEACAVGGQNLGHGAALNGLQIQLCLRQGGRQAGNSASP